MTLKKIILIVSLMILLLASCKSQKQVITEKETQVEVVEKPLVHETYKTNIIRDTVFHKDSVIVLQKGDTVYNKTIREFHHYSHTTDTVHQRDTITQIVIQPVEKIVEKQVEVEVEKKTSAWQNFRMMMGDFAMGAIAVLLGVGIVYFIRKKKKLL